MEIIDYISDFIVNDYIRGAVVFVTLFIILRLLLYVGRKSFVYFSSKTKTDLDDMLVERLVGPFSYLSFFLALGLSIPLFGFPDEVTFALNGLVYTLSVIIVAVVVHHIVNILIFTGIKKMAEKSKSKIDDTLFSIFNSILNIVLVVLAFLYILSIWGVEIGPLLAGLGIAGIAIALALQPILSNIFSGIAIVLDGTVKTGDLVYLEGESIKGKIDKIGLRSTRIRTFDNEYIILPNNKLSDSAIQNIGLPEPKSRVVIPFGVAYGSNIAKVKKLIISELKKVKNIVKKDGVWIRFIEMADSSLNFKAYFYVDTFEKRAGAKDEANTRIYNALMKANIQIPFPQMDVHMHKE